MRPFCNVGEETRVTAVSAPMVRHAKPSKKQKKALRHRREQDDEPYRQYLADYGDRLRDGIAFMFGDHPRED